MTQQLENADNVGKTTHPELVYRLFQDHLWFFFDLFLNNLFPCWQISGKRKNAK